eukprot:764150-Hanusia_phi.AAC.4
MPTVILHTFLKGWGSCVVSARDPSGSREVGVVNTRGYRGKMSAETRGGNPDRKGPIRGSAVVPGEAGVVGLQGGRSDEGKPRARGHGRIREGTQGRNDAEFERS